MAKILGKTHSPYVPDADTHSLTLRHMYYRHDNMALDP